MTAAEARRLTERHYGEEQTRRYLAKLLEKIREEAGKGGEFLTRERYEPPRYRSLTNDQWSDIERALVQLGFEVRPKVQRENYPEGWLWFYIGW